jgi:hypothetical protein
MLLLAGRLQNVNAAPSLTRGTRSAWVSVFLWVSQGLAVLGWVLVVFN